MLCCVLVFVAAVVLVIVMLLLVLHFVDCARFNPLSDIECSLKIRFQIQLAFFCNNFCSVQ